MPNGSAIRSSASRTAGFEQIGWDQAIAEIAEKLTYYNCSTFPACLRLGWHWRSG